MSNLQPSARVSSRSSRTGARPFRIGATSFIKPGSWIENARWLAGRVQDVELLFFDGISAAALPDASERAALSRLKREAGFTYSAHLPLAPSLASPDRVRREHGVTQLLAALAVARELAAEHYVLHVYRGEFEGDVACGTDSEFRTRAARSIEALLATGIEPQRLCVEQLDYDLAALWPLIADYGLSIALDVGHLQRDGVDLRAQLTRYLPRTRIVQWHGTEPDGRDHRSLQHFPPEQARWLLETLLASSWAGVLTLEVFREPDFHDSLQILSALLAELGA